MHCGLGNVQTTMTVKLDIRLIGYGFTSKLIQKQETPTLSWRISIKHIGIKVCYSPRTLFSIYALPGQQRTFIYKEVVKRQKHKL